MMKPEMKEYVYTKQKESISGNEIFKMKKEQRTEAQRLLCGDYTAIKKNCQ